MRLRYVLTEVLRRPVRTMVGLLFVAVGLALFLSLSAYADAYRNAARAPLAEIGTDIVAQREGDRPKSFDGVVFPHSTAPIRAEEVDRIGQVDGVEAVARAVFFWSFQNRELTVGLGIDPAEQVGPGRLRAGVKSGRFLATGDQGVAVVDSSYAVERKLAVGSQVPVAGENFKIVGVVDTSRAGQVANANVYLPLADAQRIIAAAPGVTKVHDVRPTDVNVVFVRGNPTRGDAVGADVADVLGSDALVTTPRSFDKVLGPTFALIDRFGTLIGLVALLVAAAGLLRAVSANLMERRRDVAVLRAVGWPPGAVIRQLTGETAVITLLGLAAGVAIAAIVTWALRWTEVTIPVPWELSPTPHFLAGGAKQLAMTVPLRASLTPVSVAAAVVASLAIAALVSFMSARRVLTIKPVEVWRE